jgi:hypothetical protein
MEAVGKRELSFRHCGAGKLDRTVEKSPIIDGTPRGRRAEVLRLT